MSTYDPEGTALKLLAEQLGATCPPQYSPLTQDEAEEGYTAGSWTSEEESGTALDGILDRVNLWKVYKEVPGALCQPRPVQSKHELRIDRVLVPNQNLISLGWEHGIIGIEVKKSRVKLGPVVSQALDYSRTIWTLPPGKFKVWLDWVFIWPTQNTHGTLSSILAQNRIGTAYGDEYALLRLKSGENGVIHISHGEQIRIGNGNFGKKGGNRG